MMDGFAFLPVADVPTGLDYLRNVRMTEGEDILVYFDSTYVNSRFRHMLRNGNNILRRTPPRLPPCDWNVFDATVNNTHKINNQREGWNNGLTHLVAHHHSHIWKLIKRIEREERFAATAIAQNEIGNSQPRKKKRVYGQLQ
ncbi:hypothetical protein DPMN_035464 [Dreissena polymorpha]|uniref:Uncharacterized protein n=1 Tax=Dreissena polymorpha TaxID=45954 RepID=A0A9D4RL12_DREPO|nr:hypothetical protein DPMN_035464 [Dreissena polymorpha]